VSADITSKALDRAIAEGRTLPAATRAGRRTPNG
jgi:hypothetical protein